ncbi:MAG: hypothetical protein PWQ17_827 [Anaerophaga sp.]|nr:hypothetical protein [Anaerophaga sp.]
MSFSNEMFKYQEIKATSDKTRKKNNETSMTKIALIDYQIFRYQKFSQ